MRKILNWVKARPATIAAIIGASFILTGVLLMIPRNPWTLIAIGVFILFCVMCAIFGESGAPK